MSKLQETSVHSGIALTLSEATGERLQQNFSEHVCCQPMLRPALCPPTLCCETLAPDDIQGNKSDIPGFNIGNTKLINAVWMAAPVHELFYGVFFFRSQMMLLPPESLCSVLSLEANRIRFGSKADPGEL